MISAFCIRKRPSNTTMETFHIMLFSLLIPGYPKTCLTCQLAGNVENGFSFKVLRARLCAFGCFCIIQEVLAGKYINKYPAGRD
jgi:hypothetical protein